MSHIHVWSVNLNGSILRSDQVLGVLSIEEKSRAAKFKFERDRRRYIIAHAALHDILAGYVNAAAADLRFVAGMNGKPSLAAPLDASGVAFNLSHSHERALIAVTPGRELGVDIEFSKIDFAFHEVAERFFTAREVAALRALPAQLQRQAFYKCWTSKEAFLKAKGTGLSGQLDEVEISLTGDERVRIAANVPGWSLAELTPGEGYEAALATEGDPLAVICYRWRRPPVP
ncbi:MAG TPA: 4'-phosphopantetheinyl transferase superfamily protein [Candidatus Limnocylindria bacterium]|nr:4'-phosphopantetheinyl transferase superfamily protein [Candidatus Limnocylindria bacterium]